MILVCEYCGKEYEYTPGQLNWGKFNMKKGKGSVDAKRYCCYECGKKAYKEKCKNTNLKRYGVENPFQAEQFKEKAKQTCLDRYGVDNSMKSKEIQLKSQETCMRNYGVRFSAQNKECLEKAKQTSLKKYGAIYPMRSQACKDKVKQTKKERYGDENYNNQEKMRQTLIDRYGDEYYRNVEKGKDTCLKKYGCISASQLDFVKEKSKQTCLKKYGVEYSFQSDNNKEKAKITKLRLYGNEFYRNEEKAKQTNLERYGAENPFASPVIRDKIKKTLKDKYGEDSYVLTEEFKRKAYETKLIKESYGTSEEENEINNILIQKFKNVKRQYYSKEYPFPCDFYVPELNLYIEYQGYWSHGGEPYNEELEQHKRKKELWEQRRDDDTNPSFRRRCYKSAINVWTVRDPLKRETARKNNLNWMEFFTMDEFMAWYNSLN